MAWNTDRWALPAAATMCRSSRTGSFDASTGARAARVYGRAPHTSAREDGDSMTAALIVAAVAAVAAAALVVALRRERALRATERSRVGADLAEREARSPH